MNAFAMRELEEHELTERRRAYLAEQIRNGLYDKTLHVNIAWTCNRFLKR